MLRRSGAGPSVGSVFPGAAGVSPRVGAGRWWPVAGLPDGLFLRANPTDQRLRRCRLQTQVQIGLGVCGTVAQAIADAIARQLERTDAPVAPAAAVEQAITSAEKTIGAALSAEQRQAAESICGSGRGAELIVGVAGAGKTTLLAGGGGRVRGGRLPGGRHRHLRAGGPHPGQRGGAGRVPDVGQPAVAPRPRPARPRRAQRGHPRRGGHDRGRPPGRPHRPHRGRRRQAGARRRPPPAGGGRPRRGAGRPGPPPPRRRPPADREPPPARSRPNVAPWPSCATATSPKPSPGTHSQGRLHAAADRDDALQQAVDAWAADVAAGHDTGLYAWRRANVAALNQRARAVDGRHRSAVRTGAGLPRRQRLPGRRPRRHPGPRRGRQAGHLPAGGHRRRRSVRQRR